MSGWAIFLLGLLAGLVIGGAISLYFVDEFWSNKILEYLKEESHNRKKFIDQIYEIEPANAREHMVRDCQTVLREYQRDLYKNQMMLSREENDRNKEVDTDVQ